MSQSLLIETNGQPLYGEVDLPADVRTATVLLISALLSDKPVHLTNVPESTLIDEATSLLQFIGVSVERIEGEVDITCETIHTHAIPGGIISEVNLMWIAMVAILARKGRSALEYEALDVQAKSYVDYYSSHMEDVGFIKKVEGDYLIFEVPTNMPSQRVVMMQGYAPAEVWSYLLLSVGVQNVSFTLTSIPWDYQSLVIKSFLEKLGATFEMEDDALTLQKIEFTEESFDVPSDVVLGALLSVVVVLNLGDIKIKDASTRAWSPLLDTFNKLNVSYKKSEEAVRIWNDGSIKLSPTDLRSGVYPALGRELLELLLLLLHVLHTEVNVVETVCPFGLQFTRDLERLKLDYQVNEEIQHPVDESENVPVAMKLFGNDRSSFTTLDLAKFDGHLLPITFALTQKEPIEVRNIDILLRYYPELFTVLEKLGFPTTTFDAS